MISQCIWLFQNDLKYKNADTREKKWDKDVEVKEETVQQKCFHSFNYVIGPTSILLGKLVDTASCDFSVLVAASFKVSEYPFKQNMTAIICEVC